MSKCGMYCYCWCIGEGRIKTPMRTLSVQVRYVLPVYWGETNKSPDGDPKCPSVVCTATAGALGRDE